MTSFSQKYNKSKRTSGFTIIELVVVIVVSGIIGGVLVSFVATSAESLVTSRNRNQLSSTGRVAIDRLAAEIRNALPNSVRSSTATAGGNQCLEFIPVVGSTTYIDAPFQQSATTFNVVDLYDDGAVTYLSTPPALYGVIYPDRISDIYDGDNGSSSAWPDFPDRGPIQEITSITDDTMTAGQSIITLTKDHRFRRRSPFERFYLVRDPISYCIVDDKLYRYNNYGFYQSQSTAEEEPTNCEVASDDRCLPNYNDAPDKLLIADSIDNTGVEGFSVAAQSLTRNALVSIELNFSANGDSIRLNHEVLSRSVP
jgi:MSHA biogenesis protein MshO